MKKIRITVITGISVILIGIAFAWMWMHYFSKTKIVFVNFPLVTLGEIYKANTNDWITLKDLSPEEIEAIDGYDMVFINGMGLHITEEQRAVVEKLARKGLPVLTTSATNPANKINSLDSLHQASIKAYLDNGGRQNYRSMLAYVRKYIDKKWIKAEAPDSLVETENVLFSHIDSRHQEEEAKGFNSVSAYNRFLKEQGLWKENAPRVIVTGPMGDPAPLVAALEEKGNVVYNVHSMLKIVQRHLIDSIRPDMVINLAHGRMGDYIIRTLEKWNIPLLAPLNANRLVESWEKNPMGMNGGFLSQSVVTPEIDGALRPYVLYGLYQDKEGLHHLKAIPERLEQFVQTVQNYLTLRKIPNSEKKIAVYYFKGPGQHALTASGMEVTNSLFNVLKRLKQEGYDVSGLPATADELGKMIQKQGAVFNAYAEGATEAFMKNGQPLFITQDTFDNWAKQSLRPSMYEELKKVNGPFPGAYMSKDGKLAVACLRFGKIALLPQYPAGVGSDDFKIVHGTHTAPPYPYVASYLWAQYGFEANAIIHFGTHGSLEFTPEKQVALSNLDWPDRLVGNLPHIYVYTIANVGEGMIAKRRSYAGLQSYLTPPFMESSVRTIYKALEQAIQNYNHLLAEEGVKAAAIEKAAREVKQKTISLGIHRELKLDSISQVPYSEEDIARIESFAEELANEKITGQLYTMGVPYENERIVSSVYAMSTEPIAYSLLALDKLRKRVGPDVEKHRSLFTEKYLEPAKKIVQRILQNPHEATDAYVCRLADISKEEMEEAENIMASNMSPDDLMALMMNAAEMSEMKAAQGQMRAEQVLSQTPNNGGKMKSEPAHRPDVAGMNRHQQPDSASKSKMGQNRTGGRPSMKAMMKNRKYTKAQMAKARAIADLRRTVLNVDYYRKALLDSPEKEMVSLVNALNGGYTAPSPGGDPIANPNTLPTGRNLFAVNAEATPTEVAWEKGVRMAERTLELYRKAHHDSLPRKVSYTLWSGEFIETEGATVAQVLYMLGVEPIRDAFGRVNDLRLIPSSELKRPRIDVVVQTSGQLRDLAASRLFLINRAVEMAASAKDDSYRNEVYEGVVETERILVEKGVSPKEARQIAGFRVFGGVNGNYGTGIQAMVEAGDRWEDRSEIARTYLNNMGAFYGSEKGWEQFKKELFGAALSRTDVVIQPRQSNTWGALSLDHVYEFMGGLSLAVQEVTGKTPEAYFSDYRNRNNARVQDLKEAIGVESRTTLFNPVYIREKMKGGATSAGGFTELVRNTYAWNVVRKQAIDAEMWNEIYEVYVKDKFGLGVQEFFEKKNPAALQEMTAVMLETIRKGMWRASDEQVKELARMHTDLVNKYDAACSGFVCDNKRLKQFITSKVEANVAQKYQQQLRKAVEANVGDKNGMVMKKEVTETDTSKTTLGRLSNYAIVVFVLAALVAIAIYVRKRRKQM